MSTPFLVVCIDSFGRENELVGKESKISLISGLPEAIYNLETTSRFYLIMLQWSYTILFSKFIWKGDVAFSHLF